jgi:hypothetical protein
MSKPFEDIAEEAVNLPRKQRLSLANLILELDEASQDGQVSEAWEEEIRARIRALDEGTAQSQTYEDVMRTGETHLTQ